MRALSVFSGGLDSMLSAELIRAQGIDVLALFFETPFFSSRTARKSAAAINLPIEIIDITRDHLKIVKDPKHGYGENMNPCIDCHAMMFRKTGEMLEGLLLEMPYRLSVCGNLFLEGGQLLARDAGPSAIE